MSQEDQQPETHEANEPRAIDLAIEFARIKRATAAARRATSKIRESATTEAIDHLCEAVESLAAIVRATSADQYDLMQQVSYLSGEGAPLEPGPMTLAFAAFVEDLTGIKPMVDRELTGNDDPPLISLREDDVKDESGSSGTTHSRGKLHLAIYAEHATIIRTSIEGAIAASRYEAKPWNGAAILYAKVLEIDDGESQYSAGMIVDALVRTPH